MAKKKSALVIAEEFGWTTRHTQVVLLAMTGSFTDEELAERFGVTVKAIRDVLNDPQANIVIGEANKRLQERLLQEVGEEMPGLARLAVKALKVTLEAHIDATHKAKPNQDKVALKVLEGLQILRPNEGVQGGIQLNPEQHATLIAAMEKAEQVSKMYEIPITPHVEVT